MLVREHYEFDPLRFMSAPPGVERGYGGFLISRLKDPESFVLVAERDGRVAGYVYGALEPTNWMELRDAAGVVHDIVVDPEHRRAGVGRLLMNSAFDWLRDHGAPRVILSTAYRNESAQKLFAAVGFRPTMIEMTREL